MIPMRPIARAVPRGGVAIITLLLVSGIALTVALASGAAAVASFRSGRDLFQSERAFAAAESAAADAARRLGREPALASLPSMTVDGIAVTLSLAANGDSRVIIASATSSGATANVRATCSMSAGTCVFRRQ